MLMRLQSIVSLEPLATPRETTLKSVLLLTKPRFRGRFSLFPNLSDGGGLQFRVHLLFTARFLSVSVGLFLGCALSEISVDSLIYCQHACIFFKAQHIRNSAVFLVLTLLRLRFFRLNELSSAARLAVLACLSVRLLSRFFVYGLVRVEIA